MLVKVRRGLRRATGEGRMLGGCIGGWAWLPLLRGQGAKARTDPTLASSPLSPPSHLFKSSSYGLGCRKEESPGPRSCTWGAVRGAG